MTNDEEGGRANVVHVSDSGWRGNANPISGYPSILNGYLTQKAQEDPTAFPDLRTADQLYIGSDYSGDDPRADYFVTSFLVSNDPSLNTWRERVAEIRADPQMKDREFAFKKLGDGVKRKHLPAFLLGADQIEGVLVTTAWRRTANMFSGEAPVDLENDEFAILREWPTGTLKKAFHIGHILALLVGGLAREGQDVVWVSDQDEIFANEKRGEAMKTVMRTALNHGCPIKLGRVSVGPMPDLEYADASGILDKRQELMDFIAIPDLAAGGFADILQTIDRRGLTISTDAPLRMGVADTRDKTTIIRTWLGQTGVPLRRVSVVVGARTDDDGVGTGFVKFINRRS